MEVQEFELPVPWGHVAGKAWGNASNPIALVFHGIMDNAGSFDRLIPLLPNTLYYLCFDLPGHGKSSHLAPYFPLYSINNIIVYKLIAQHFKREKYTIIGHSYGGQLAFLFAQLYPEFVERIIMLDTIHLFPLQVNQFRSAVRERLDYCIELDVKLKSRPTPTYTYEECLQKMQEQRFNGFISPEAAAALLKRGIAPAGDGKFKFTVDQRLKQFINPMHDFNYILGTIKNNPVTCPVLMVLGRDSHLQQMYMKPVLKLLGKYKNIRIKYVDGHHDVHNNEPEVVAPYMNKFLLWKNAKL